MLNLSSLERKELESIVKQAPDDLRMVRRCTIILLTENGVPLLEIADRLGVSKTTANTWRQIFKKKRIVGLIARKPLGRPPKLKKKIASGPFRTAEDRPILHAADVYVS